VLAVFLFLGFWVLLALGLFFVAIRGGIGGARAAVQTQGRVGRAGLHSIFVFIYIGFGVVIPIALLTGNHANASARIGGLKLTAAEKTGRTLFGEHCGVCHTLAAANAIGKVGPNLDQIQPADALVLKTIANGCLQNASASDPTTQDEVCLGEGTMPSGILQGDDATDVAAFVARVAGKE
jgi:mono/diheme cytochrome c family protein